MGVSCLANSSPLVSVNYTITLITTYERLANFVMDKREREVDSETEERGKGLHRERERERYTEKERLETRIDTHR